MSGENLGSQIFMTIRIDYKAKKVTISISGMHCSGCARKVENAIRSVEGVKNVFVDLPNNKALIEMEEKASLEAVAKVVSEVGYKVEA